MLKDTQDRFGSLSLINHWLFAVLFIGMLIFGLVIEDMPRSDYKGELMGLHKSIGVLLLFFGAWRVFWRLQQGFPKHVDGVLHWEKKLAKIAHFLLLFGILLMPLSGYIMSEAGGRPVSFFGLFTLPEIPDSESLKSIAHSAHGLGANMVMVVILLHIAAAIKHHVINKDATLMRMLGR